MKLLLWFLLKLLGYSDINFSVISRGEYVTKKIEEIIKQNGFVVLNKKGEVYLKGFTLLEIIRKQNTDKTKGSGEIVEVRLKHDIDSVVSAPSKQLTVAGRYTNLQNMINYFDKI